MSNVIPTKEEYEKALQKVRDFSTWMSLSNERIMGLVDSLTREKELHDAYEENLINNKRIVMTYELAMKKEERGV